jgi:KUP system potassium uptake protein
MATLSASMPVQPDLPKSVFFSLALGAVGVVFGDIGTSPLYAFREALGAAGVVGAAEILGVLSLAIWALILIVTVKYVLFLMRMSNQGEGGVLSLMALAQKAMFGRTRTILLLGALGAALFYGDAIITPAISVLSAVEGLKTIPALSDHVGLPTILIVSTVILAGLFMIQARGTDSVAKLFGPICAVWFLVIGGLGLVHLMDAPQVLAALNPLHGVQFVTSHGMIGLAVLGAVFLTVTGAEALTADMGHFGRAPIQAGWLLLVFPALCLNYFGQGAFALKTLETAAQHGHAFKNQDWFFLMAPEAFRPALVVLATMATVIASQAVITGAFSLTQQAVQLGLLPRMDIRRTSGAHAGQIYIPRINGMLFVGVLFLVMAFKTSSGLAHAYGIAVTGTMVVTTILAFVVVRRLWNWSLPVAVLAIAPFLALDVTFFGANALKIMSGGFVPLALAGGLCVVMGVWVRGVERLAAKVAPQSLSLADLLASLNPKSVYRAPGTAIFLSSDPDVVPVALMHNLKHNKVLHEKNAILTIKTVNRPHVDPEDRLSLTWAAPDFAKVVLNYGYMEAPNVVEALTACRGRGLPFDLMTASFFLSRRTIVRLASSKTPLWQDKLFASLNKNAADPTTYFHIPPGRVVEMGAQVAV